jgi:molecular chaperone HscA
MALLQLAEPGQSAAPHQHRLAAGIDLGTTNSLVATVRSGRAETLPGRAGAAPAALGGALYLEDGSMVGEAAKAAAADDPLNTIASVKRLMGAAWGTSPSARACPTSSRR